MSLLAHTSAYVNGNSVTSSNIDTTGAKFIAVVVTNYANATTSISDSKSNTWTALTLRSSSTPFYQRIFYCINPSVGTGHNFTAANTGTSWCMVHILAFSDAISSFSAENGGAPANGSTLQPGSVSPGSTALLLTGVMGAGGSDTLSINSSFTVSDQQGSTFEQAAAAYKIQTSVGAENPTWSTTGTFGNPVTTIAAFILSVPTITTTSLPNGTVGSSYNQTLSVSGGTGSITWSVVSGSLPAGLSLNSSTGVISGTPTAVGTSSFTVRATDSLSAFDDQALSITINAGPTLGVWTQNPILPRGGMQFWYQYQQGDSADGVCLDYSGNGRNLSTGTANKAILTSNALNGQPGWYFNGAKDPMVYTIPSGNVPIAHLFILASADEATFGAFRGLFGGGTQNLLVGDNGTDEFFDFTSEFTGSYYKSDVPFTFAAQKAPMNGQAAFLELQINPGPRLFFTALQIGQQTNLTTRLWKGYFYEAIGYSSILNDAGRQRVREYFAMRYWAWPKDASNTYDVFPFAWNRTNSLDYDQETFLSTPYSGDPKGLVRGSYRGAYNLPFILRTQEEFDATKQFLKLKGRTTPFVIRDFRYYPYREIVVRRVSSLREQGSDTTYRFNYNFDVQEVSS